MTKSLSPRQQQRKPTIKPTRRCLIFGGVGFIGSSFADYSRRYELFDTVILADIKSPRRFGYAPGVEYVYCDTRLPITEQVRDSGTFDWIINLAAVHREPGHDPGEYFDTNVQSARHVCDFAAAHKVANVLFTSSISVYGPTPIATDESQPCHPDTAYGASKLVAEEIHRAWQAAGPRRRLVIARPGVVYGPGDRGNMLRLIHALQTGLFVLPGNPEVRKSYAYIEGLCEAFAFVMQQSQPVTVFNYVERETLSLGQLIAAIQAEFSLDTPIRELPSRPLEWLAFAAQVASAGRSPIHPQRVKKLSRPTHIVPQYLHAQGFEFQHDFASSLKAWRRHSPQDFLPTSMTPLRFIQTRAAATIEALV